MTCFKLVPLFWISYWANTRSFNYEFSIIMFSASTDTKRHSCKWQRKYKIKSAVSSKQTTTFAWRLSHFGILVWSLSFIEWWILIPVPSNSHVLNVCIYVSLISSNKYTTEKRSVVKNVLNVFSRSSFS